MTREELKAKIIEAMHNVAQMHDSKLVEPLTEETVLLQSGLDSLGFATLVASLEFELDYDPFVTSEEAYYPSTLKEFVDFYDANKPQ